VVAGPLVLAGVCIAVCLVSFFGSPLVFFFCFFFVLFHFWVCLFFFLGAFGGFWVLYIVCWLLDRGLCRVVFCVFSVLVFFSWFPFLVSLNLPVFCYFYLWGFLWVLGGLGPLMLQCASCFCFLSLYVSFCLFLDAIWLVFYFFGFTFLSHPLLFLDSPIFFFILYFFFFFFLGVVFPGFPAPCAVLRSFRLLDFLWVFFCHFMGGLGLFGLLLFFGSFFFLLSFDHGTLCITLVAFSTSLLFSPFLWNVPWPVLLCLGWLTGSRFCC